MQTQTLSSCLSLSRIKPDDLIIVPTDLLAGRIKRDLVLRTIPHNPDLITTLQGFCRYWHDFRAHDTRIITEGEAFSVLTGTLELIKKEVPFFFNQGNPSASTVRDLHTLRSIFSQRRIDPAHHPLGERSEKFRQISSSLKAYEEQLNLMRLHDNAALIEWTIRDISAYPGVCFESVTIYQVYDLLPREQELVLAIRNHAAAFMFCHLPDNESGIFSPPDWLSPEDLVRIQAPDEFLCRSALFLEKQGSDPGCGLHARIFDSTSEEYEAIAEEIHTLSEAGTDLSEIAIIFPDATAVLPELQNVLDDSGIPFHSYLGEPLVREPVIGFLLLLSTLDQEAYPRERVISLLSSPYFQARQPGLPPLSLPVFDQVVRKAGIEGGRSWEEQLNTFKTRLEDPEAPADRIKPSDIDAVLAWITAIQTDCNSFSRADTPGEFAHIFHRLCARWMHHQYRSNREDDPLPEREVQAYNRFLGYLDRLVHLAGGDRPASPGQLRRWLLYLLEEPVNLSVDRGGVRILGLRQATGMEYTAVFLAGLVEGDIPHPSTRFPFLTSSESEQLGSRGLAEAIRNEQYHFIAALAAGKQVWLSAAKVRGEKRILTSSFLEAVCSAWNPPQWGRENLHSLNRASVRAGKRIRSGDGGNQSEALCWLPTDQTYGSVANRILVEDWYRTGNADSPYDGILTGDEPIVSWLSEARMFGTDRIWSPTRLEVYAGCPFRFFLEQVVRIQPLPDIDLTLSPARRGTLIHDTLCSFYRQWCAAGPRRITSQNLPEALALLTTIAEEASTRYRYQSPLWHATSASLLGYQGIPGLYDRYLSHEAGRDTQLIPSLFELEIGSANGKPGEEPSSVLLEPGEGEPFRIRGRVDRVDLTPGREFAIIDYKTGSSYPNRDQITEGKALQLPLYLLALEQIHATDKEPFSGIGGSYIEIGRKVKQTWPLLDPEKRLTAGLSTRSQATQNYREVLRGSLHAAGRYIAAIRNGIFPVTQDRCRSGYCQFSTICRYDRFRMSDQEED